VTWIPFSLQKSRRSCWARYGCILSKFESAVPTDTMNEGTYSTWLTAGVTLAVCKSCFKLDPMREHPRPIEVLYRLRLDGEVADANGLDLTGLEEFFHLSPDLVDGDVEELDLSIREG